MRGKPIMPEEPAEKAAIEHKERLYKAIAMLNDFIDGFSNIAPEEFRINPEEIADQSAEMKRYRIELLKRKSKETDEILKESPAQLFARRCEKEKLKNLYFNRKSFAKREKDRSMQVYELIKSLPGMILELDDTRAYVIASDYNQYLDDILSQKEPEESSSPQKQLFTFKGKHKPKQRNVFRRGLIEEGFIADISEGDFEYWFSEKPIYNDRPRINFLTHANHATYMLRELVDDYENPKLNKHVIANLCLSFPNDPNTKIDSNTYPTKSRKNINKFNKIFNRTT
jgi:hypothetical protein